MSIHAISWALKQQGLKSSEKFVLVCLADNMNDSTGLSFPCVKTLCEGTCQDRKTVLSNLQSLIKKGLINDSGDRVGATKQVIAYRLNMDPADRSNSTENGTSTKNGTVPDFPLNSTVFPAEQYRFSPKQGGKQSQKRDTEPKKEEEKKKRERRCAPTPPQGTRIPEDFELTPERRKYATTKNLRPEEVFEDFCDYWKAKAGRDALKADWDLTWKRWCRNQKPQFSERSFQVPAAPKVKRFGA